MQRFIFTRVRDRLTTTFVAVMVLASVVLVGASHKNRAFPPYRELANGQCGLDVDEIKVAAPDLQYFAPRQEYDERSNPERAQTWARGFIDSGRDFMSLPRIESLLDYGTASSLSEATATSRQIVVARVKALHFDTAGSATNSTVDLTIERVLKGSYTDALTISVPGGPLWMSDYPRGLFVFFGGVPLPLLTVDSRVVLFLVSAPSDPSRFFVLPGSGFYRLENSEVRALPSGVCESVDHQPEAGFIADIERLVQQSVP